MFQYTQAAAVLDAVPNTSVVLDGRRATATNLRTGFELDDLPVTRGMKSSGWVIWGMWQVRNVSERSPGYLPPPHRCAESNGQTAW